MYNLVNHIFDKLFTLFINLNASYLLKFISCILFIIPSLVEIILHLITIDNIQMQKIKTILSIITYQFILQNKIEKLNIFV